VQSIDTIDNGKPFTDALDDIDRAARITRYFAGVADKIVGQTIPAGMLYACVSVSMVFCYFQNQQRIA